MKRTTKRRLGLAGLVVAGMLVVVFVASKGFTVRLAYYSSTMGNTTIPGYDCPFAVGLSRGMVIVHVSHRIWMCKGSWKFDASFVAPSKPFLSWPGFTVPIAFQNYPKVFRFPLSIIALVMAIPSFFLWQRNAKLSVGHCNCGYDLTGNVSGVCSECGTPIPREK